MKDVYRCPRLTANFERFLDRFDQPIAFITHVSEITPAVFTRHRRQRSDLACLCINGWRVDQRCGNTDRARLHRFTHERLHRYQFFIAGASVDFPHDDPTNLRVPHRLDRIDGQSLQIEQREVFRHRGPPLPFAPINVERSRRCSFARIDRRDSLRQ